MLVQNLQPAPVEIETTGPWRLDGKVVEIGARVTVPSAIAADLIARGKARRVVPQVAPVASPEPAPAEPPPAPETPPAPVVSARGKK